LLAASGDCVATPVGGGICTENTFCGIIRKPDSQVDSATFQLRQIVASHFSSTAVCTHTPCRTALGRCGACI
jgi:hypothetical protein